MSPPAKTHTAGCCAAASDRRLSVGRGAQQLRCVGGPDGAQPPSSGGRGRSEGTSFAHRASPVRSDLAGRRSRAELVRSKLCPRTLSLMDRLCLGDDRRPVTRRGRATRPPRARSGIFGIGREARCRMRIRYRPLSKPRLPATLSHSSLFSRRISSGAALLGAISGGGERRADTDPRRPGRSSSRGSTRSATRRCSTLAHR